MALNPKSAEELAYWYFRLNGFFTIKNFVVHPDMGIGQQTDIDVFGVRFPHRSELLEGSMEDDDSIIEEAKIHVVFVEVKSGVCNLNSSWKDNKRKNIHRFLTAVGALDKNEIDKAAESLYKEGCYENDEDIIEIVAAGNSFNMELDKRFPESTQIFWGDILRFIYSRFDKFKMQKSNHSQWDEFGRELWENFRTSDDEEVFIHKYLGDPAN